MVGGIGEEENSQSGKMACMDGILEALNSNRSDPIRMNLSIIIMVSLSC